MPTTSPSSLHPSPPTSHALGWWIEQITNILLVGLVVVTFGLWLAIGAAFYLGGDAQSPVSELNTRWVP